MNRYSASKVERTLGQVKVGASCSFVVLLLTAFIVLVIVSIMALNQWSFLALALNFLLPTTLAEGSLKDINHVVLFMQENRAFDHYFGTMAGIRGFSDPNVQVNPNGRSVWYQDVDSSLSNTTDYLLPWYLNYLGGNWTEATQCLVAGDNGWNGKLIWRNLRN